MLVRRKQNWWRDPSIITNILLAIFTGGLVGVGVLQWHILDQTDETLREGERSNVYIMDFTPKLINKEWWFVIWANNSGSTRATSVRNYFTCANPNEKWKVNFNGTVVNPQQKSSNGACRWGDDQIISIGKAGIPAYISGHIFYKDAFTKHHVTRYCRKFTLSEDPAGKSFLPAVVGTCEDEKYPDCVDDSCPPSEREPPSWQ